MTEANEQVVSSELPEGMRITGLWNKNEYRIVRKLGEGAAGQVYLVTSGTFAKPYALKLAHANKDLGQEIKHMRRISPGMKRGHGLFVEADRYAEEEGSRAFYVMTYLEGDSWSDFLSRAGDNWLYLVGYHLLRKLAYCHGRGYAFGDLKPSNMIVSENGRVDLIDYGGVSPLGTPIRQCTEVYDRQYWNCGSRMADPGYDLFSFAMLFMQHAGVSLPGISEVELLKQERSSDLLLEKLATSPACAPAASLLAGMIKGEYTDSRKVLAEWRQVTEVVGLPELPKSRISRVKGMLLVMMSVCVISWFAIAMLIN